MTGPGVFEVHESSDNAVSEELIREHINRQLTSFAHGDQRLSSLQAPQLRCCRFLVPPLGSIGMGNFTWTHREEIQLLLSTQADGVILGADTRATNDSVVVDKSCEKIHFIAPKIYCCGAGVAADTEMTTWMAASKMEIHALSTGHEPRVATVIRMLRQTLFRYQGHVGASLIMGGVDLTGPDQLYGVHPHGSYSRLPSTALGSGQDAALALVEDRFQPNMTLEAAQELLVEAITAGILGDLGSGGSVDACVITAGGAKLLRTLSSPTKPVQRASSYHFAPGTTAVLTQEVRPLNLELLEETVQAMELSTEPLGMFAALLCSTQMTTPSSEGYERAFRGLSEANKDQTWKREGNEFASVSFCEIGYVICGECNSNLKGVAVDRGQRSQSNSAGSMAKFKLVEFALCCVHYRAPSSDFPNSGSDRLREGMDQTVYLLLTISGWLFGYKTQRLEADGSAKPIVAPPGSSSSTELSTRKLFLIPEKEAKQARIQAVGLLLLLESQCVDVNDCGVDIPHVDDFGFFVAVLVKDGVGTDENEDADTHGERAKHLHLMPLKEAHHHTALVPNHLCLIGGQSGLRVDEMLLLGPIAKDCHGDPYDGHQHSENEEKARWRIKPDFPTNHHDVSSRAPADWFLILSSRRWAEVDMLLGPGRVLPLQGRQTSDDSPSGYHRFLLCSEKKIEDNLKATSYRSSMTFQGHRTSQ
ncbi:hypothetical protein U0070_017902 [Myodes glareolus]|uniref:Proteasome beta subunit C-terminal domain-containing protein n=1 Tax=Myodes glareolus TaxID=447135 RepID=A0AAW0K9U8_MYOGA